MKADRWDGESIVRWKIEFKCPVCDKPHYITIEDDNANLHQLDITCDCNHNFKVER